MLKDFAQLLSRHASGAGLDELADLGTVKKKSIELTPGQSAVTAIHEGASAGLGNVARINNGQPDLSRFINATPLAYEATGEGGGRGLGDGDKLRGLKTLGLISKGISDQVSKIQPSQDFMPEQSFAYAQNPIAQKLAGGAGLQMYAKGGKLSEDDINIVGEAGPEAIVNDEVIPLNPEMVAKSGGQAFPQSQLGIDQTEQQDQTVRPRIVGQDGMATPDASQLLSQRDQLMQQAQDVINRKRSKWGAFSDVGLGIVQGLNNAINHRDDPIIAHSEAIKQRDLGRIGQQIGMIDSEDARKQNNAKIQSETGLREAQGVKAMADAQKQLADIEHQKKTDNLAGKKWDILEQNGLLFEKHADGTVVPWIDPTTQKQGVKLVNVPVQGKLADGTPIYQTGNQAKTNEVTQLNNDLNRTQQTVIHNSDKQFEADKTNVSNMTKYNSDMRDVLMKTAEANANLLAANPALTASNTQIRSIADTMAELTKGLDDPNLDAETFKEMQKQMNSLQNDMDKAQKDFYGNLSKVQGGTELVKQLKSAMPVKPKMVKFNPIQPSTTGRPIPKSKDPLGLFQ